jgi:DnaJ-class molecular chaperone
MVNDLYSALELPKGADSSEIRKAYLRLSRTHHPDKVPADQKEVAEEKFKKIAQAYEVLSDDSKKSFYDQTGQIPGEGGGGPPPGHPFGGMPGMPFGMPGMPFDMNDLFGMFHGGRPSGPGGHQSRQPGKAPARKTQIPLTLKDFYNGRTLQIKLERQRFCGSCKGEG